MAADTPFLIPNRTLNETGELRSVGFELEFAGIPPDQTATILATTFAGQIEKITEAEYKVSHRELDPFKIELDWQFGQGLARRRLANNLKGVSDETDLVMKWMTSVAGQLVPTEIVSPPIPLDQLDQLNPLVTNLREGGALGTEESLLYAFGVHINPEIPDYSSKTIIQYLQAFIISQHWLSEMHKVDFSRRISPYIELFSNEYATKVIEYQFDDIERQQIITDYLHFNPSRNRALDMLPLFKFLEQETVATNLPDEKINERPTFHYRLPNCEIGTINWSLEETWNLWCVVEHLACQDDLRNDLIKKWHDAEPKLLGQSNFSWHCDLTDIYQNLLSA